MQIQDTRTRIENTKEYPYCCIGLVTGKLRGRPFHGTGCLITSRIVLTCAHNLYDRYYKEEYTEIKFSPGVDGRTG